MNQRHLRVEDLAGRRWRGLVRESTQEQADQWSPVRQRNDLRRAADELGLVATEPLFYERTGSGEQTDAVEVTQALSDARGGAFDVLLVLHTSRLARSVSEARRIKAEARKIGLVIYFTAQRLLSGSRTGALMEGLNEVLDEHANEERRFWIAGGHRERQAAGRWLGNIPVGYRKRMVDRADGSRGWDGALEADHVYGPIVRRIFNDFAAGTSPFDIALALNSEIPTPGGGAWRRAGIVMILHNPVYTGVLVRYRDKRVEHYYAEDDPHDGRREIAGGWGFIEPALFEQVQVLLAQRATRGSAAAGRRHYPLSGILRCACGEKLSGVSNGTARYYRCHGRAEKGLCREPFLRADRAEREFARWLGSYRLPVDWPAYVKRASAAPRGDVQAKRERLTAAMERLKQQYRWGHVTEAVYKAELAAMQSELATTSTPSVTDLERFATALVEMGTIWSGARPEQQVAMARLILVAAIVVGGRISEWVVRDSVRPVLDVCQRRAGSRQQQGKQWPEVRYSA